MSALEKLRREVAETWQAADALPRARLSGIHRILDGYLADPPYNNRDYLNALDKEYIQLEDEYLDETDADAAEATRMVLGNLWECLRGYDVEAETEREQSFAVEEVVGMTAELVEELAQEVFTPVSVELVLDEEEGTARVSFKHAVAEARHKLDKRMAKAPARVRAALSEPVNRLKDVLGALAGIAENNAAGNRLQPIHYFTVAVAVDELDVISNNGKWFDWYDSRVREGNAAVLLSMKDLMQNLRIEVFDELRMAMREAGVPYSVTIFADALERLSLDLWHFLAAEYDEVDPKAQPWEENANGEA